MIRDCAAADFEAIYKIINDAAEAYRGIIPPDRWHEPYMPRQELKEEMAAGVAFLGYEQDGEQHSPSRHPREHTSGISSAHSLAPRLLRRAPCTR